MCPISQLNLAQNELCGLDYASRGTYTAEGIAAIADALQVNASLTRVDVTLNGLGDESKNVLRKAVEGRSGFELAL